MKDWVAPKHLTAIHWRVRIWEWLTLLRIIMAPNASRSDLTYNVLSQRHVMGDDTLFINLGYWLNANTLDEAAADLARYVSRHGHFTADEKILDVGFGFADQDILWCKEFGLRSITGINISGVQVETARQRVHLNGLDDRIHLQVGDATRMDFAAGNFDKVVGMECAFHFRSREAFLHEAARVTRPGGSLVLADFIGRKGKPATLREHLASFLGRRSWQIPAENLYDEDTYRALLSAAGYDIVDFHYINDQVFERFVRYQRQRFDTDNFRQRYHPLVRWVAKLQIDWGFLDTLDYVFVHAIKRDAP